MDCTGFPSDPRKHIPGNSGYPELQNAIKQWEKPIEFTEIVTKLQEKNLGCSYYEIDPKTLQREEVLFLIAYPFMYRVSKMLQRVLRLLSLGQQHIFGWKS